MTRSRLMCDNPFVVSLILVFAAVIVLPLCLPSAAWADRVQVTFNTTIESSAYDNSDFRHPSRLVESGAQGKLVLEYDSNVSFDPSKGAYNGWSAGGLTPVFERASIPSPSRRGFASLNPPPRLPIPTSLGGEMTFDRDSDSLTVANKFSLLSDLNALNGIVTGYSQAGLNRATFNFSQTVGESDGEFPLPDSGEFFERYFTDGTFTLGFVLVPNFSVPGHSPNNLEALQQVVISGSIDSVESVNVVPTPSAVGMGAMLFGLVVLRRRRSVAGR